jgi:predicted Zn-ribbon and HTH transcriptional regulator
MKWNIFRNPLPVKTIKGCNQAMSTIRRQMMALLTEYKMDARALSQALHIREKDVYDHLHHISISLANQGKHLRMAPFRCLSCGYEFKDRKRFHRPGRCPTCKRSHMEPAVYWIESEAVELGE